MTSLIILIVAIIAVSYAIGAFLKIFKFVFKIALTLIGIAILIHLFSPSTLDSWLGMETKQEIVDSIYETVDDGVEYVEENGMDHLQEFADKVEEIENSVKDEN